MANLWEMIFQPDVVNYLAALLEEQRATTARLNELSQRLQTVADRLQVLVGELAAVPLAQPPAQQLDQQAFLLSGGRYPIPLPSLTLPVSPKTLNEMILSVELGGHLIADVTNTFITALAGQVATLELPIEPSTVVVFIAPLQYTATYYSSSITISLTVDDRQYFSIGGTPSVLSGAGQIEIGQYAFARKSVKITVTNNSTMDTTIFAKAETIYINRRFFDIFYAPLLNYDYSILKALATLVNGGQEVT